MEIKEIIIRANSFARLGDTERALECYSQAFDYLVKEASEYAGPKEEAFKKEKESGKKMLSEKYLKRFNEYLKRDRIACELSCSMAVLFSQVGERGTAKVFFEQAINLTPDDIEYNDPYLGLEALK